MKLYLISIKPRPTGYEWAVRIANKLQEKKNIEPFLIFNNTSPVKNGFAFKALEIGKLYILNGKSIDKILEDDSIVHIHGWRYSALGHQIVRWLFRKGRRAVVLVHKHGSLYYSEEKGSLPKSFLLTWFRKLETYTVKNAFTIFTVSMIDCKIGRRLFNTDKIRYLTMGVDLDMFKIEKCKQNESTFRFIFVGRFDDCRGAYTVLKSFLKLKRKYNDKHLKIIFVGGSKRDKYYNILLKYKKYGVEIVERVPYSRMPVYYRCSNAFVWYCKKKVTIRGGIGISPLEALASGIPVISNTFIDIADTESIPDGILIPSSEEDVYRYMELVYKGEVQYDPKSLREFSAKFSWERVINKLIYWYEKAEELLKR